MDTQTELERGDSVADGVRRIALGHVDAALDGLAHPGSIGSLNDAAHEVRKRIRRARSALLLLKPAIGKKRFKKLDRRLRRAGTCLSVPRDAAAAVETLDVLAEHYEGVLRPRPFAEVRAHLVERLVRSLWNTVEHGRNLVRATRHLERARAKLGSTEVTWTKKEPLWTDPVHRSFKAARKSMRKAFDGGAPEDFHEWRKVSKNLRHHLRLLRPAWGGGLDQASLLMHELTDLLGEHHDLAALRTTLAGNAAVRSTAMRRRETRAILGLIEGRSREIEEDLAVVGRRLFSRRPDEVARRLRTLWEAWKDPIQ